MTNLVCGVGVNDISDPTTYTRNGKQVRDHFYATWCGMLNRCYSEKYKKERPTYEGCFVCDEWKLFSNFKKWMLTQDWEGKQLDKDLLVGGNKEYSPQTCLFVSHAVNSATLLSNGSRGAYPVGVYYNKRNRKYRAKCNDGTGTQLYLGVHQDILTAHQKWQMCKMQILSSIMRNQDDWLVRIGLQRIIDLIGRDYDNGKLTVSF